MKKVTLPVKGMYCSHCSKAVTMAFNEKGITASVDLSHNCVSFTYDETKISLESLKRVVKRAGYDLVIDSKPKFDWSYVTLGVSIPVLLFSIFGMIYKAGVHNSFFEFFGNDVSFLIVASIAVIFLGTPFIIRAIKGLKYKNVGMDFLIALSALVSYVLSLYCLARNIQNGISPLTMSMDSKYLMTYFDSTTMVLSIITIGHFLIDSVKRRADKHYKKATLETPKLARRIISEAKTEEIDPDFLDVGDKVIVLSGETLPTDGKIYQGHGFIDEAALTGESRPRYVNENDLVYGGTVLSQGPLVIEVTKIALDSFYSSIINESYVLDQKKGKLSRISDKVASIFTPAIILVAIMAFFICFYGLNLSVETSLVRAASVLCVACPCAFGLAVPISAMSGFDCAMSNGVLFKTGDMFEKVSTIKAVVFDKTGTLSTGHLVISARVGEDGYLPLVKGMEMNSNHPLSKSIIESLPNVTAMKLNDVNEVPGFGLTYKEFVLGSEKTSLGKGLNVSMQEFIKKHESSSLVFLSNADTILLIIALDDGLVPDAKQTIEALKKKGIKSYMLTGDRKTYALKVAGELGINEECIYSEATPSDKAKILADIRKKEGVICYVGDGINDTLALKESDMSFASYKGSEIASSSADGVLLKPELMTIYYALLVSKKTYINIIENFVWAIVYNLSMIPLTIMGILPMSFCGLVMIVSNLTLTINSLRIKFYKPNKEGL